MVKNDLSAQFVRELLDYNAQTGDLTWRARPIEMFGKVRIQKTWNSRWEGVKAGAVGATGYRCVSIGKSFYRAHRLAWLHFHGSWPDQVIDHINGNRLDNRIENLRDVSQADNVQNVIKVRSHNSTGFLGTTYSHGRFQAAVVVNRRKNHIGSFDTAQEAHEAYLREKRKLHPGCTI